MLCTLGDHDRGDNYLSSVLLQSGCLGELRTSMVVLFVVIVIPKVHVGWIRPGYGKFPGTDT